MRKAILTCVAVLAAAVIAPLGAQAHSNAHDGLRVTLVPPLTFAPTADCPTGAAVFGVAVHGETGSGTHCILSQVLVACPPDVTAQFCQSIPGHMTLSFQGGLIQGDVTIFEAWNCTATCAVDQRWSGTVSHATLRFHGLEGGSVSGGGLFAFNPATGQLVTFDEALVITPAD